LTKTWTDFTKEATMNNNKQSRFEDLAYWKNNAEENYMTTPISVLKYIHKLEEHIETIKAQLPSNDEMVAKWMRDKIQGGNK
jgi:hypothetical protein